MIIPQQVKLVNIRPSQAATMPMQVSAAQNGIGIDISSLMGMMLPVMIVMMMVGMMGKMFTVPAKA